MQIGIMQGRLLPPIDGRIQRFPRDEWEKEFPLAAEVGLHSIEWIYEVYGEEKNPLGSDQGIQRIKEYKSRYSIGVHSVCADYFMDQPLLRVSGREREARIAKLEWLMRQCQLAEISRIVLPFVDASRIEGSQDANELISILQNLLPVAESCRVELHLETALAPEAFAELLTKIPHPLIKVNYDSGNSAALGYKPLDEFAAYGERIGSVHLKDRVLGGATVPLGTGNADLDEFFKGLSRLEIRNDLILQVARNEEGKELEWAQHNLGFAQTHLQKSASQK